MTQHYHQPLLLAFLALVILVLISVIFVQYRFDSTNQEVKDVQQNLQQNKLTLLYFETFKNDQNFCEQFQPLLQNLSTQVNQLGDRVYALEQVEDPSNIQLLEIKREYTLQNLELWLYFVNVKKQCESQSYHTMVYFYTNQPGRCLECKAQEFALQEFGNSHPNVYTFAIEGEIGLPIVETLKKAYQITQYPSLVIDENQTKKGFQRVADINQFI